MENMSATPSVSPTPKKHTNLIKWAFVFGIALISNLFAYYVVQALYPEPEYNAYCDDRLSEKLVTSPEMCRENDGRWITDQTGTTPNGGYCDLYYQCQKNFENDMKVYGRNVFVVFIILGTALLLGSAFLASVEAVTLGLAFGGVLSFIIGSMRYWSNMQEWLRVIVLGVALAGLIYFAWKKYKNEE